MKLPKKCLVDTNVPKTANLATQPDPDSNVSHVCVLNCIEAVEHVIKKRSLVIDAGDEIFDEYRQQLSMRGQPGVGDRFMKWVHDHRWSLPQDQRVSITRNGYSYDEFPTHDDLSELDISDRKFVAVANSHPDKPPILQATDSKWWGWKDALAKVGITVQFLCQEYVEAKYAEKMGT
uniref:Uncharacterized protein n=1 Tax=Desulfatirhabdium butyrativorans TaxID=340467 RepID=A0A7C4RT47_9BACT